MNKSVDTPVHLPLPPLESIKERSSLQSAEISISTVLCRGTTLSWCFIDYLHTLPQHLALADAIRAIHEFSSANVKDRRVIAAEILAILDRALAASTIIDSIETSSFAAPGVPLDSHLEPNKPDQSDSQISPSQSITDNSSREAKVTQPPHSTVSSPPHPSSTLTSLSTDSLHPHKGITSMNVSLDSTPPVQPSLIAWAFECEKIGALARLKGKVKKDTCPPSLFDELLSQPAAVVLLKEVSGFRHSEQFNLWLRLQEYIDSPVSVSCFKKFRVLGKGAFGSVSVASNKDTHAVFAMKQIDKRIIKSKNLNYERLCWMEHLALRTIK